MGYVQFRECRIFFFFGGWYGLQVPWSATLDRCGLNGTVWEKKFYHSRCTFFGVGIEKEIIPMRSERNSVKP